jgi:hypothetical protein
MTPSCAQECLRWADETDNEEYRRWVWGGGRMSEVIGRFHQNGGRVRDQATVPQEPTNAGLGHKAALAVREVDGPRLAPHSVLLARRS